MERCVNCNQNLCRKGFLCDECTDKQNKLHIKLRKQLKEAKDKLDKFLNHTPSPKRVD